MKFSKIHQNDEVIVLTGKYKGQRGKVRKVYLNKGKAIVEGINLVKKHQKPIPNKNESGGIIAKESLIDLSNLAIFNFYLKKADRIKFKVKDGEKFRIFKSDGNVIK